MEKYYIFDDQAMCIYEDDTHDRTDRTAAMVNFRQHYPTRAEAESNGITLDLVAVDENGSIIETRDIIEYDEIYSDT